MKLKELVTFLVENKCETVTLHLPQGPCRFCTPSPPMPIYASDINLRMFHDKCLQEEVFTKNFMTPYESEMVDLFVNVSHLQESPTLENCAHILDTIRLLEKAKIEAGTEPNFTLSSALESFTSKAWSLFTRQQALIPHEGVFRATLAWDALTFPDEETESALNQLLRELPRSKASLIKENCLDLLSYGFTLNALLESLDKVSPLFPPGVFAVFKDSFRHYLEGRFRELCIPRSRTFLFGPPLWNGLGGPLEEAIVRYGVFSSATKFVLLVDQSVLMWLRRTVPCLEKDFIEVTLPIQESVLETALILWDLDSDGPYCMFANAFETASLL